MDRRPPRTTAVLCSRLAVITSLIVLASVLFSTAPADAAGMQFEPFHDVLERVNPCSGEDIVVVVDGTERFRVHEGPSGRYHFQAHFSVSVTTSDGFAGTARQTLTAHDGGERFVLHSTALWHVRDDAGRTIQFQERVVYNGTSQGPRVAIEHQSARCLRW
jgi:hypothetical protein